METARLALTQIKVPDRIGPRELAPLMRRAGGMWEPGSKVWLIERRRIGPVIRALRGTTDPLFRRAGLDLDLG